jgi:MYXO-CTERM domain-containing protein
MSRSMFTPATARRLAGAVALLVCAAAACAGDPAEEPPGALSGELVVHVFRAGEQSQMLYMLRLPDGAQRELRFADPPELASGERLRVFGADDGKVVQVARFEALGPGGDSLDLEWQQQALIGSTAKPAKRWAFVLVDTGSGVNLTAETARQRLFSDEPESIRSYYREVSYGLQELSGDVLGPYSITPPAGGLCDNFTSVAQQLLPMISGSYNQYLWYLGSRISGCPWEGVAQLGKAASPTKHSFYNASSACVVLVQEPGHNFGMVHSSSLRCVRNGAAASMIADSSEGQCSHSEYGNPFDPMGGGSGTQQSLNRCFHMNGVQKAYQDWLGGCNVVKATTSGTYTLYPLEKPCDGLQLLQVPLVSARTLTFPPSAGSTLQNGLISSYYVELRAPVGLDAGLQTPRVYIVAAGELRDSLARGNPNWLIDTAPDTSTLNDAALAVGKSFTDPAPGGPKITVVSADATKAVVQVQLSTGGGTPTSPGQGVCANDAPFFAPGPQTCNDPVSAPPDGGAPDAPILAGGGVIPGGPPPVGSAPGTTNPDEPTNEIIQGGCACHTTGPSPARGGWLLVVVAALIARRRRR